MTALVALIGLSCTAASAIDSAGVPQYCQYFGVSRVVGSLTTGLCAWLLLVPLYFVPFAEDEQVYL